VENCFTCRSENLNDPDKSVILAHWASRHGRSFTPMGGDYVIALGLSDSDRNDMNRFIGPFATLLALILLGIVAAGVVGSLIYGWLQEVGSGRLGFKPTLTRRKHTYSRQLSFLE